jgi:hypothetical protein
LIAIPQSTLPFAPPSPILALQNTAVSLSQTSVPALAHQVIMHLILFKFVKHGQRWDIERLSCSDWKQASDVPAGQLCMHANAGLMCLLCMIEQAIENGEAQGGTPLWACWLPNMWASSMESSLALPSNLTPATSQGVKISMLCTGCDFPISPCTCINRS